MHPRIQLSQSLLLATVLLLTAWTASADQYRGNGDTGSGGAIGNGTLTLSDDGTNISGTLAVGGSMNDVLVLYIQTGPGGFTNTSGFNDRGDSCRQAISGVSAAGRSVLTFASGFQPNYAIALAPAAAGTGGLWQLANGDNNSLVYMGSVNLGPLNNTGPYAFSFPAALIGMIPGVRSTIQEFGTYVRADGYRSSEALAGNLTGVQGWNPFTQTFYASYTFDANAVLIKLPTGFWAQRASGNSPGARDGHTAVWTGSEMIIWGGENYSGSRLNDGSRFNPVANSWTAVPSTGAPLARSQHTAVWTGSEMIVWGGHADSGYSTDGGRYNPVVNSWTALPAANAPVPRVWHTAVWTGSEMIVWGGWNGNALNDGGRFNPVANSWNALPGADAPAARHQHTAVWTGSEMIIWGGFSLRDSTYFNTGGRYDPLANTWTDMPISGAPQARDGHVAVWTGTEMIVWGGFNHDSGSLGDGGRYSPVANTWADLPMSGAPRAREACTAVWTGSEMIVWGGQYASGSHFFAVNDGGRFNPTANHWTALTTTDAPAARVEHTAAWTGSEMIIWGGLRNSVLNDGGRYNPAANTWRAVPAVTAPAARDWHAAVWTGSEMIVWGGYGSSGYMNDGGRYNLVADTWTALPMSGAPSARAFPVAVWSGSEIVIWGGWNNGVLNDGGRYSPVTDTWTAVPTAGAPAARYGHTAVWAGTEMILWGGYNNTAYFSDGGRFNPTANSWTALSGSGAPAARADHTAVWTGSDMIVWGGLGDSGFYSDGARYNPVANHWTTLPVADAPAARRDHTAVWTGSEMIVWGGTGYGTPGYLNDGARYNPVANTWTSLPTQRAPAGRELHTAVWTGNEMIVWGGANDNPVNNGGRYNPAANAWGALATSDGLAGRVGHTAVWTGIQMIVWGGYNGSAFFGDTWPYYPYGPAVRISRSEPTSADVVWPVWSPSLRLCQTTDLGAGNWTTVTNAPTQVGSESHVIVSPLSGRQFFRVEYP